MRDTLVPLVFYRLSGLLFFLFALSSCTFNPNVQGKGADFIQGVWEEEPLPFRDSLLKYTQHHFKFTCDSFYVRLETHSKVNYYEDSCFNKGLWKEYARGTYLVRNDTLYLLGTFTKENYKQKLSGCYRIGQYLPVFLIKEKSPEMVELESIDLHLPVRLRLREKIICDPKPL